MFLLFFIACNDSSSTKNPTSNDDNVASIEDISLIVAQQICSSIYECCDRESQSLYFSSYLNNQNLSQYHEQLPPSSEEECLECSGASKCVCCVSLLLLWSRLTD